MTEQDVINFAEERIEYWYERLGIDKKPYKICVGDSNVARGKFTARKYPYGLCKNNVRLIVIDYRHVKTGTEEMIKDTILHEIAHALDFDHNGYSSGHGRNWKRIARMVGATPKATAQDTEDGLMERVKSSKYVIIDQREPTKARGYAQRRLKRMENRYYPDDRSTKGNLFLVETEYFLTGDWQIIMSKAFR